MLHRFGRFTTTHSIGECWYRSRYSDWFLFHKFNKHSLCRFKPDCSASIQTDRWCSSVFDTRTRRLYSIDWWFGLFNCHLWWIPKTFYQMVTSCKYFLHFFWIIKSMLLTNIKICENHSKCWHFNVNSLVWNGNEFQLNFNNLAKFHCFT